MSYEEILEKIKKAKALADSKKVEAGIQDKDMGYVNFFQWNYSGVNDYLTTSSLTTVSDTGYTTFKASVAASKDLKAYSPTLGSSSPKLIVTLSFHTLTIFTLPSIACSALSTP